MRLKWHKWLAVAKRPSWVDWDEIVIPKMPLCCLQILRSLTVSFYNNLRVLYDAWIHTRSWKINEQRDLREPTEITSRDLSLHENKKIIARSPAKSRKIPNLNAGIGKEDPRPIASSIDVLCPPQMYCKAGPSRFSPYLSILRPLWRMRLSKGDLHS